MYTVDKWLPLAETHYIDGDTHMHIYTVQLQWSDQTVTEVHVAAQNCSSAAEQASQVWGWFAGQQPLVTTVRRERKDPVEAAIERYESRWG